MDFQLTRTGDLVIESGRNSSNLDVTFFLSEQNKISIAFNVESEKRKIENKQLIVSFIHSEKSDLTAHAKVIKSIEEKIQAIRTALRTERGELPRRQSFGSLLYEKKHEDIHDPIVLEHIKQEVMTVARLHLSKPSVLVSPAKGVGSLYFHNVSVKIFEEGTQIYKFYL